MPDGDPLAFARTRETAASDRDCLSWRQGGIHVLNGFGRSLESILPKLGNGYLVDDPAEALRLANHYNYAFFLSDQQRPAEAREWAQRILDKKPNMPGYLRRRERPWFRRAQALLNRLH